MPIKRVVSMLATKALPDGTTNITHCVSIAGAHSEKSLNDTCYRSTFEHFPVADGWTNHAVSSTDIDSLQNDLTRHTGYNETDLVFVVSQAAFKRETGLVDHAVAMISAPIQERAEEIALESAKLMWPEKEGWQLHNVVSELFAPFQQALEVQLALQNRLTH